MITQLLILADPPEGSIGITWADEKVWSCPGCNAQLTSTDLHGTSAESVIDHADDCSQIASIAAAAVKAERERIVKLLAERVKTTMVHPGSNYLVDAVPWTHLLSLIGPGADLLKGETP